MRVLHDVDLRKWHTLASPAVAETLYLIESDEEIADLPEGTQIIGAGSNIIFREYIRTPLARLVTQGWTKHLNEFEDAVCVTANAGHNWHDFVAQMVANGWQGLENLALIPGTVGAAPVQNIGAYGVEVAQYITRVTARHRDGKRRYSFPANQCGFAYRYSHFKDIFRDWIITQVHFSLNKVPNLCLTYPGLQGQEDRLTTAQAVFDEVVAIRRTKLPDPGTHPNAGSFFHNPVVDAEHAERLAQQYPHMPAYPQADGRVKIPAAWLIEQAGLKGFSQGAVGISPQHALVLVNHGGTGGDILRFAAHVKEKVRALSGIDLHIEPTVIGENSHGL